MRLALRIFVLSTFVASSAGCYGQFALTKKVHRWNGQVSDNAVVHSLLFWALIIVPVYEVVTFVDAAFFNVVEFWTGDNLLDNPDALARRSSAMTDGSVVFETHKHRYRIYPEGTASVRIYIDGRYAGRARQSANGDVAIHDSLSGQSLIVASKQVDLLRRQALLP